MPYAKRMFAAALLAAAAWGASALLSPPAFSVDCSIVRCPGCPDGYVFKPTGNNCCRCVPAR
jgi:hypothetical protein